MQDVKFFFDPICPWAWMTSRWILEAAKVRELEVTFNPFSLSQLNKGRDLPADYRKAMDKAWGPARVVLAAREKYGQDVVLPLYTALGTQIHLNQVKDYAEAIKLALAELDLDADLAKAADTDANDSKLEEANAIALKPVGDDVGTPIIHVGDQGFFGPVISPAPKGEDAGKLWDGVVAVGSTKGFFEIKRSRNVGPIFD